MYNLIIYVYVHTYYKIKNITFFSLFLFWPTMIPTSHEEVKNLSQGVNFLLLYEMFKSF